MPQNLLPTIAIVMVGALQTTSIAQNYTALREPVLALGELTDAPTRHAAEGFAEQSGIKAIYFDALPWKGRPTRVFAWLGIPKQAEGSDAKVPGIVLVHGGGGTAFLEWVKKWNEKGFAAISIAVEGQTDVREPKANAAVKQPPWTRHPWAGPARQGIYNDSAEPLVDQWMYHAVADTVLANSLLRSLPEVDPDQVGLMGISWGGIITSTVIGIDDRFAFAIPTYGCGSLADVPNQYGAALSNNQLYREVWDPMVRMTNAKMPILWLSWTGDKHFPLDSLSNCYRAAPGPRMVALLPKMGHSHQAGWNPPDSYAFAETVVRTGKPWCWQTAVHVEGNIVTVQFSTSRPIDEAVLTTTLDTGFTGSRTWSESAATLTTNDGAVIAKAMLPTNTTAWFINIRSGDLIASSDFQVLPK